jgi:hypothetical protein
VKPISVPEGTVKKIELIQAIPSFFTSIKTEFRNTQVKHISGPIISIWYHLITKKINLTVTNDMTEPEPSKEVTTTQVNSHTGAQLSQTSHH